MALGALKLLAFAIIASVADLRPSTGLLSTLRRAYVCSWMFFLTCDGTSDILIGVYSLITGIEFGILFDNPFLASSPRDLWSRRWNLPNIVFFREVVFEPVRARLLKAGVRRRVAGAAAATAVFGASAAVHEAIVVLGTGETRGEQVLFFSLHGAVCILQTLLEGLVPAPPRALAILATSVFFSLTNTIFLAPFERSFGCGGSGHVAAALGIRCSG
eukprot:tig00000215_g18602.t1